MDTQNYNTKVASQSGMCNELSSHANQEDEETKCSALGWRPKFLQFLASKKIFVLAYGILGMNQSAIGAYFGGTISTLEKRFRIPSTKMGLIASAWEIGTLLSSMVMAYFGGRGNNVRWLAIGSFVAALSCFVRYIPHFLYGPGHLALSSPSSKLCSPGQKVEDEICSLESEGFSTFLILFSAHFIIGVGTSTYETLGTAYLDNNTLKNKMPFLFGIAVSIRGIGPTVGAFIASYTLSMFIDPSVNPLYGDSDPRWLGAWWYGWIPLGIIHIILSFIISMFPKTLPREAVRRKAVPEHWSKQSSDISLEDFFMTVTRLIKNPILMLNSFSTLFYIIGMMGYWVFMAKYVETLFRVSASEANFVTGVIGVVCLGLGMLSSGAVLSYFRPRPYYIAAWNVFTEVIDTFGHFVFAFIGCSKFELHGETSVMDYSWSLMTDCNVGCDCPNNMDYQPSCSMDGITTFFSPCHAGCLNSITDGSKIIYTNCSCIGNGNGYAVDGFCSIDCKQQYYLFIVLLVIMKFLSASGRAGNILIQFRSVEPQDKAISLAMTEVLLCTFAFIPAPILFGYLLDSCCLVWGYACQTKGNCWLYDGKVLRYILNFTSSGFLLIATLLDIGVLMKVGNLQVFDKNQCKDGQMADIHEPLEEQRELAAKE